MNYNFLFHLHTSDTAIHPSFMIWRCRRWAGYIYLLRRTPVRLDMKVAKVAICFKKRPRLRIAEAKKTTCKKDLKEESCWQKPKVFGFYIYKMFELGVSLKNWLTHQYLHPNPLHPPQNCQETVGQCDACCGMARLHSWCFFCGVKFPFQVLWSRRTNTENGGVYFWFYTGNSWATVTANLPVMLSFKHDRSTFRGFPKMVLPNNHGFSY